MIDTTDIYLPADVLEKLHLVDGENVIVEKKIVYIFHVDPETGD
jgi:hypothetical protein